MSHVTQYATSLENVRAPVRATQNGLPYDPTGDQVQMAFIPTSQIEPASGDWNSAAWETDTLGATEYLAICLVGPGAVELTPGAYSVFVRITDNPEVPVIRSPSVLQIV